VILENFLSQTGPSSSSCTAHTWHQPWPTVGLLCCSRARERSSASACRPARSAAAATRCGAHGEPRQQSTWPEPRGGRRSQQGRRRRCCSWCGCGVGGQEQEHRSCPAVGRRQPEMSKQGTSAIHGETSPEIGKMR
jgi:hypothetical protein